MGLAAYRVEAFETIETSDVPIGPNTTVVGSASKQTSLAGVSHNFQSLLFVSDAVVVKAVPLVAFVL